MEALQNEYKEKEYREAFEVVDLSTAGRALRIIKKQKEYLKEQDGYVKNERLKIDTYEKRVKEEAEKTINYMKFLLSQYLKKRREENPKYNIETMEGTVYLKKPQAKWTYENEEEILKFLKENEYTDLIKVKESIDTDIKNKFKVVGNQVVTEDGEIVPFITVDKGEETLVIRDK